MSDQRKTQYRSPSEAVIPIAAFTSAGPSTNARIGADGAEPDGDPEHDVRRRARHRHGTGSFRGHRELRLVGDDPPLLPDRGQEEPTEHRGPDDVEDHAEGPRGRDAHEEAERERHPTHRSEGGGALLPPRPMGEVAPSVARCVDEVPVMQRGPRAVFPGRGVAEPAPADVASQRLPAGSAGPSGRHDRGIGLRMVQVEHSSGATLLPIPGIGYGRRRPSVAPGRRGMER